jgi:hypothetical protein
MPVILFTLHPDKAEVSVSAEIKEEEFEKVRGLYTDGSTKLASRRCRRP